MEVLVPSGTSEYAPTGYDSAAYEAGHLIKTKPGCVFGLSGYNSNAAAQFIQIHDARSTPADTAVPKVIIRVAGASNFAIDFGVYGKHFDRGIYVCNSSTGPTKTIGAADCWFNALYK